MQGHSSARAVVPDARRVDVLRPLAVAVGRQGADPLKERLIALHSFFADDLASLEQGISALETDRGARPLRHGRVKRAAEHLLALPGKRIRPMCVLLSARMGGRRLDSVVRDLAVACELVHAATLLHDDVIDDAGERRGAAAARVIYGNAASILAGDHLLVEALRLVQDSGLRGQLSELLDVIAQMVSAEALQLERRGRFEPDRDSYMEVIRGKTAALFNWGLRAGGVAGDLGANEVEALGRVGVALGTAFQLVDDVLDLDGDAEVTGKDALTDLREGKLTWPVIIGSERDPRLRDLLGEIVADSADALDASRVSEVVTRLRACGALTSARELAVRMAQDACGELEALPADLARDALVAVVESAVFRAR